MSKKSLRKNIPKETIPNQTDTTDAVIIKVKTGNKVVDNPVERPFDDGTGRKMFIIASPDFMYEGPQYEEEEVIPNLESYDGTVGPDGFIPTKKVENANEDDSTITDSLNSESREIVAEEKTKNNFIIAIDTTTTDALSVNPQAGEENKPENEHVFTKPENKPAVMSRVYLVGTSYHYYRQTLKNLFRDNQITTAKFVKNPEGWKGHISIPAHDKDKAMDVLNKYKTDNPAKEFWWNTSAN